ncbi:heme exporter protein CcmD [Vibrio sp. RC27]
MLYFDSMSDFIAMGGYAVYVWSSFGITFISGLWLLISSMRKKNKILAQVKQELERQARIEAAKTMENTL